MNSKNLNKIIDIYAYIVMFIIVEKMLGTAGIGLLLTSLSLYYIVFTIMMGSVMKSLAKMVAVRRKRGFLDNAKRIFTYCLMYTAIVGVLIALFFIFIAPGCFGKLFNSMILKELIPILGILFIVDSFNKSLKGYYLGCGAGLFLIIAQILKSVVLVVGVPFAIKFSMILGDKAVALHKQEFFIDYYGALGVILLITVANLISLLALAVGIKTVMRDDNYSFNEVRSKDGFKAFLRSFLPVSFKLLSNNLFPLLTVGTVIFIYIRSNFTNGLTDTVVYGNVGMLFAEICLVTFGCVVIFEDYIAGFGHRMRIDIKKDDRKAVNATYNVMLKNTITILVPICVSVITFSKHICIFLTGSDEAKGFAVLAGFMILLWGFDMFLSNALDAKGHDSVVFIGKLTGFLATLVYSCMSAKNGVQTKEVSIALIIYISLSILIHAFFVFRDYSVRFNDILARLVKVLIGSLILWIIDFIVAKFIAVNIVILIIGVLLGYLAYCVALVVMQTFNQKDIQSFKGMIMFYPLGILGSIMRIR